MTDLFVSVGELSGDLHGAKLIEELLALKSALRIGATAGPRMRALPIKEYFAMENLQVMGFVDVLLALPKLIRAFYQIRNQILRLSPKAVVCIDYPDFHLRLEKSLRKKGFTGKIIHLVCPTVWAWRKQRVFQMAKTLDLLLTFLPFEPACFAKTMLPVRYVGHPLALPVAEFVPSGKFKGKKILALFPGSRETEIARNLPLQLQAARAMRQQDPEITIALSVAKHGLVPDVADVLMVPPEENYELMRAAHGAIATSGTVTLELALHGTPTVVNFAIKPIDQFIAQKILRIDLPYYCLANIVVNKAVFPELYGSHLTTDKLFFWTQRLWSDEEARAACKKGCEEVRQALGRKRAGYEAASAIIESMDF